jgi:ABC-type nickel/cobalt efflux system permease component RcnA
VIGRPAAEWLDRGGWIVSLVVLALLGGWWLARRWRRRRAAPSAVDQLHQAAEEGAVQ